MPAGRLRLAAARCCAPTCRPAEETVCTCTTPIKTRKEPAMLDAGMQAARRARRCTSGAHRDCGQRQRVARADGRISAREQHVALVDLLRGAAAAEDRYHFSGATRAAHCWGLAWSRHWQQEQQQQQEQQHCSAARLPGAPGSTSTAGAAGLSPPRPCASPAMGAERHTRADTPAGAPLACC